MRKRTQTGKARPQSFQETPADALVVNLFSASEVRWTEKGVTLRQDTRFPDEDMTRLRFTTQRPVPLTLRIRHPGWAPSIEVAVNGRPMEIASEPSSYVDLRRTWHDEDVVTVRMPMPLHLEPTPDNPARVAILHGPIVLAGDLGPQDDLHRAFRLAILEMNGALDGHLAGVVA